MMTLLTRLAIFSDGHKNRFEQLREMGKCGLETVQTRRLQLVNTMLPFLGGNEEVCSGIVRVGDSIYQPEVEQQTNLTANRALIGVATFHKLGSANRRTMTYLHKQKITRPIQVGMDVVGVLYKQISQTTVQSRKCLLHGCKPLKLLSLFLAQLLIPTRILTLVIGGFPRWC
jgi:hypothetical protein